MIGDAFDFSIGAIEIALALTVLLRLWRFRRGFPWLIALTAFFLLRGADRVTVAVVEDEPAPLAFLLDALLLVVLVLLLLAMERMVRGLDLALDAARFREREYHRALLDYRTLVRHRLANPITAIIGSVQALKELNVADPATRTELLDVIDNEARRLETVSLDPHAPLNSEEQSLRPVPARPQER